MRFHLKCTNESLRAAFRRQNGPQPGRGRVNCPQAKGDTAESREVGLTGNREILEQP